jgi:death-on-curing protein
MWIWLDKDVVCAAHDAQILEHGGLYGIRDENLLESAMARPQNLAVYENPGVARLAAAYAVGISRNHPFLDANKRTAIIAVELFLELNGYHFVRTDEECFDIMPRIATGEVTETDMATWIAGGIVQAEDEGE